MSELPLGRTDIDGDNVYVNVFELEPGKSEEIPFETHSVYMDLQVDLEGAELCEVALGELTEKQPYDEEKDAALYGADTSAALVLGTDRFAVFMVEEPHKQMCIRDRCWRGRHVSSRTTWQRPSMQPPARRKINILLF